MSAQLNTNSQNQANNESTSSAVTSNPGENDSLATAQLDLYELQYLAAFTQSIADAVVGTDTNYIITSWNKGAEILYDWTSAEVLGKPAAEVMKTTFFSEEDKNGWRDALVQRGYWQGEVVQQIKDGTRRDIFASIANIRNDKGEIIGVVAVNRDITRQKRLHEELRAMKEQLELTFRHVPSAIYQMDKNGRLVFLNEQAARMMGYESAQEVLQEKDIFQFRKKLDVSFDVQDENGRTLPPDGTASAVAFRTKKPTELVTRVVDKNSNQTYWVLTNATPIFDDAGELMLVLTTSTNITERKKAEEKVKTLQRQLELTIANIPAFVYLFDDSGHILYANKQGLQNIQGILGEAFDENEDLSVLMKKMDAHVEYQDENGKSLSLDHQPIYMALRSGKAAERIIKRIDKKTGRINWFLNKVTPLFDEEGKVQFILSISTDITEQKEATEKIRLSEIRFRSAVAAVNGILWTNNARGEMEGEQPGWASITGQSYEEYQGYGWSNAVHPDDIQATIEAWNKAVSERRTFVFEHRIKTKSGEWRRFSIRAIPILNEDGSIYEWVGVHTDITEQRKAEESVRESEERFRTLTESLPQLVWMMNEKGEHDYASSKWKEYTGVDPSGLETWQQIVHPDDFATIMNDWAQTLQMGGLYRSEARLKSRTGMYRWHFVQGEPIRNEDGKIIKWIGAFTDIHDQKTLAEKLEKLVTERTRDLQRSNEDLLQFAHVASHDLKEPVRKIRTFTDRLYQEFGNQLPEKASIYLKKIEEAASRMYQMIDGVLDYSAISTNDQSLALVDLNQTIQHIESDLEVVIQQKNAVIACDSLPQIEGSPILLHQLFYNLINNSLKFARAGVPPMIQFSSTTVSGTVAAQEWGLSGATEYVRIFIQDNGIGFSQDQAERIFKTFTRLNAKDKYEGTGLGLALCKKIVERHHGVISAVGMEGMGAIFKVVLPVQQLSPLSPGGGT